MDIQNQILDLGLIKTSIIGSDLRSLIEAEVLNGFSQIQGAEITFSENEEGVFKPLEIKKYFLKTGRLEISSNYNRSILSINNNMIQHFHFFTEAIDFQTNLQPTIMKFLANTPYRSQTSKLIIQNYDFFISNFMIKIT